MSADSVAVRRGLEVHDLFTAALFLVFGLSSLVWPDTGRIVLPGLVLARGYVMGPLFLVIAGAIMLLGRLDSSGLPRPLVFFRDFYPQLAFPLLFGEAIELSAPVARGGSHDAWFAWLDAWFFGFDPTRTFSANFSGYPVINEIIFASYFSFYAILAFVPWLPWFRGKPEVSRRQMAAFSGFMFFVFTFYIFFRVMGPKYFFPDLRQAWYGHFKGGIFTSFFVHIFDKVNLSGAAFPSSHVAISVMFTLFAWRHNRWLALVLVPLTGLIMTATVYIYAHWVADVLGGVLAVLILLPLLEKAYPRLMGLCERLDGGPIQ